MKRYIPTIVLALLFTVIQAQRLCVVEGNVTTQYTAAQAGEMTYADNGATLTIAGKTYTTSDITLNIDKQVVLKRLMANTIVKINLMNITCNRYQQTLRILCDTPENTVKNKIVKFLLSYSSVPKGAKELKIKMVNLADILHETRLKVSQTLNDMEREGLLTLQRGYIAIPEIQDLYK